jgi:hypothetical protein
LRKGSVASVPPIVIDVVDIAVPLPVVGVPVDVDNEHGLYVMIPTQITSI